MKKEQQKGKKSKETKLNTLFYREYLWIGQLITYEYPWFNTN